MWAAWSWYRFLQPLSFELELAVDGKLQSSEKAHVRNLFPGLSFFEIEPILLPLCEQRPELYRFFHQHPLGRKLGLLLALSQRQSFLYSDHDVLAFKPPIELMECVEANRAAYIREERDGNCDFTISEMSTSLGLEPIPRFNSGLMYVPRGSLSIDLAAQLLASWQVERTSWFTEQTVLSILMRKVDAQPLPHRRYVVSSCRQFYWQNDVDYQSIAARHFTGTVRHVMYRYGIPEILRQVVSVESANGKP